MGADLLEAVIRAFGQLEGKGRRHLKVFTGPFLPEAIFNRLSKLAAGNVTVDKFTADFLSYLAAADLSVSMGGYNTTMNILASKVPALVWPFPQNREQRLRAERLADLGWLGVLGNEDLHPDRLAVRMDQMFFPSARPTVDIDLNGAAGTARWLENWSE